jgi:NAD(P)-dependent dehydrogenase (short-subunit alcohol dehydrogenase family)
VTPLDELWSLGGRSSMMTGAARGFGAAIARWVAEAGATVAIADLRPYEAESTAALIADETGSECIGLPVNVPDEDSVTELFAAAESRHGSIDLLVNNASVFSNSITPPTCRRTNGPGSSTST